MRGVRALGLLCAAWLLAGIAALDQRDGRGASPDASGETSASVSGWGSEAIGQFAEAVPAFPLIAIANACGLGTSSCARCHDGRRAVLPPAGDATPWHGDHAKVPYSCVGCHQGNPRVMRQDTAHTKLVARPLSAAAPDQHCKSCHKGSDAPSLARRYLQILTPSP